MLIVFLDLNKRYSIVNKRYIFIYFPKELDTKTIQYILGMQIKGPIQLFVQKDSE